MLSNGLPFGVSTFFTLFHPSWIQLQARLAVAENIQHHVFEFTNARIGIG